MDMNKNKKHLLEIIVYRPGLPVGIQCDTWHEQSVYTFIELELKSVMTLLLNHGFIIII
jgi:hypothetical protein